jgi:hypothetical protein
MMSKHHVLRGAYVGVPMVLVFAGEIDPNHPRPALVIAALVMCLPAIVVTMPFLYIGLAGLWNVMGDNRTGPVWLVTLAWVVVVGVTAAGNLWLLDRWRASRTVPNPG